MSATASARTSLEDGSKRPELDESLASAEKANDESVPQVAAAQGPFKRFSEVLSRFGVEVRGVDRVPDTPTDRRPKSALSQIVFWWSLNLALNCIATGYLGQEAFGLTFRTSAAVIVPFVALGCCLSAYIATLGPTYGLRTIILTRYCGGFSGTFLFALLNVLTQLAYAVQAAIAGGQAIRAVNGASILVGVVVVSVCVLVVAFFGYRVVHVFERYAWIGCFIIYLIVLGLGSRGHYDPDWNVENQPTGVTLIANVLSFGAIMFSVGAGWTSIAADWNVSLPSDTPFARTFVITWVGTFIPICFTCLTSASLWAISDESYVEARENDGLGGILGRVLEPAGAFGKICLVLLAFSTISANAINTYSGALSMQSLSPIFMRIPRVLYVLLFWIIYVAASIAGREHFSEIVANVAALLAYFTAIIFVQICLEYSWFRRAGGPIGRIDPDAFTQPKALPPGWACLGSFACAAGGAAASMSQVYYVGPIAKAVVEPYGADLGFEFCLGITAITYFAFRTAEIKVYGR